MNKLKQWWHKVRPSAAHEVTITARVLKIDTDVVTEQQIAELVARCQPVVIRYSSYHMRKINGNTDMIQ